MGNSISEEELTNKVKDININSSDESSSSSSDSSEYYFVRTNKSPLAFPVGFFNRIGFE